MLLTHATLADGRTVDVRLGDPAIEDVGRLDPRAGEQVVDLTGYVLLPAPAEPHAHLDKALTADRAPNPTGDLLGAITAMQAMFADLKHDDVVERATRGALVLLGNGATAVRSHVNVGPDVGLVAMEAVVEVREALRPYLDLQLVALVSSPVTGAAGAGNRALLRDALDAGADVAGGCPHLDADPAAAVDVCLAAAARARKPVDLHTDETLNPQATSLAVLAERVAATEFPHGVTASHCVSLGMQPAGQQRAVATALAATGVAVVTLPQTNLFLQGRGIGTAQPRGLTAVRALLDAGVTLAGGGDNLRDPFNPMGRGDPLEAASLLVTAGHLTPAEAYAAVSTGARAALGFPPATVARGARADLLAIRAASLDEAVAAADPDRYVWHRGTLVARTRVDRRVGPGVTNGEI